MILSQQRSKKRMLRLPDTWVVAEVCSANSGAWASSQASVPHCSERAMMQTKACFGTASSTQLKSAECAYTARRRWRKQFPPIPQSNEESNEQLTKTTKRKTKKMNGAMQRRLRQERKTKRN